LLNRMLQSGLQSGISRWISKVERPISGFGMSHTSPFIDKDFVRVAFQVSDRWKIRRLKEKYILRAALRTMIPKALLNVPKFPARMRYDLAFSETLDRIADRWLSRERIERRGFFCQAEIARLRRRRRGEAYGDEWGMRIWTATATEIWAEIFLDRRGAPLAEPVEEAFPA
jgi:asparagine synthase (glutamine-hydrolysing)